MKKCKKCGDEVSVWYYRSHSIKYDSDMDIHMDGLDGPFCHICVMNAPVSDTEDTS